MKRASFLVLVIVACLAAQSAQAAPIVISTGNPDGKMAMASRPENGPNIEIEAADDFIVTTPTLSLTAATFVGLVPSGASISRVDVEIYRGFPLDSDTSRVIHVPTRANSPSDIAFNSRDSAAGDLTFTTTLLNSSFTAANSVLNGIHPSPGQTTGGDGAVSGQEVQFNITFKHPITLPAGHYFFIPQVQLSSGDFYWLSAPRPIVPPGTPFTGDLQAWIRNADLDPDWLRVGGDIVGVDTFNGTFSLTGEGFSTGNPDGLMAMASRPQNGANIEIEAADDFVVGSPVAVTGATFVGLLPTGGAAVSGVDVAIYRIFPLDSDTVRTIHVPTRANSPSDDEFVARGFSDGNLTFTTAVLNPTFTAANSVLNGIHPSPGQLTGGEGPVTGQEVQFDVTFTTPIVLAPGHYFFVPQVQLASGNFYWLSAPRPIVPPGTPFAPDLQAWMRNADLAPDWLRVGGDIVGVGTFNATFSLALEVLTPLELSPAHLWIGLKNSDDQGTQFDLKVELLKNGTPVASGLERCITGVTRNPLKATEAVVPFDSFGDVFFGSGDVLALRASTRIGTRPDDTKCFGPGGSHNNAVGLRLYYDAASRPSRFDATVSPNPNEDLFLHSDGNPCANAPSTGVTNRFLDATPPGAVNAKCKDSGVVNFNKGNPFSEIGTWSVTVP